MPELYLITSITIKIEPQFILNKFQPRMYSLK